MQLHTWWPFMETTHRLCGWSKHAKTDCDMADGPETAINHRLSTIIWPIHASRCSGCFVPPAPSPFQVSTPSPPQKGTFQQCQHVTVGFCIFGSSTKSVDGVHERLVHQGNYSLGYKHVSANNADHPQTTWLVQTYGKKCDTTLLVKVVKYSSTTCTWQKMLPQIQPHSPNHADHSRLLWLLSTKWHYCTF